MYSTYYVQYRRLHCLYCTSTLPSQNVWVPLFKRKTLCFCGQLQIFFLKFYQQYHTLVPVIARVHTGTCLVHLKTIQSWTKSGLDFTCWSGYIVCKDSNFVVFHWMLLIRNVQNGSNDQLKKLILKKLAWNHKQVPVRIISRITHEKNTVQYIYQ